MSAEQSATAAIPNSLPWGDKQIARFQYRVGLFKRRGMREPDAETLADRLAERDWEKDDRRTCVECKHLQRSLTCFLKLPITVDWMQLIRCEGFEWQTP